MDEVVKRGKMDSGTDQGKSEKRMSLTHQVHDTHSLILFLHSAVCVTLFPLSS